MWGGRFSGGPAEEMARFADSLPFDRRLWAEDLDGSMAYARALARCGVLTAAEAQALAGGLEAVRQELAADAFAFAPADEDIHTAVERRLGELIGPVAGKLHTGRSRNDQVATDMRLWLRAEADALAAALTALMQAALEQAERHRDLLMPGYTHMQPAQPIRFSHWLLAHFWAWQRDAQRLTQLRERVNVCPLGAGALAGNSWGVDRQALAADLGFVGVTPNSLDAVSDRDFVAEFLFWAGLLGVHLSRLAEDLVLWSTPSFGFVRLSEGYTTGSSLMPHKRNPDSMELLRGKSGRLLGSLVALLTTLKGLPAGYNRDLQEDKEPLFDAVDTLAAALPVAAGVVASLEPQPQRMEAALSDDTLATDLAEYLVQRGVPFRESHHLVGRLVQAAEEQGVPLRALPLAAYQEASPHFAEDVYAVFDYARSVNTRDSEGGTALSALEVQLAAARRALSSA
ncbi:MAG: argininosuccinate lyase [Chloroflexi bacterium]|nr:argininosuccinate lyase [Chloroflexota bacterium]